MNKKTISTFLVLFLFTAAFGFSNWMLKEHFSLKEINTEEYTDNANCIPPSDLGAKDTKADEITIYWTDDNNLQWEYYVQTAAGGTPSGGGILTNNKEETITRTNGTGGGNLLSNTEYEFWIRSICGGGKNSGWIGPFIFKTLCDISLNIPFWEGFNSDSTTRDCWITINFNPSSSQWRFGGVRYSAYEGDADMEFININNEAVVGDEVNEWLISPELNLDVTKIYRLSFHQSVSPKVPTIIEVLASNQGIEIEDFNHVVLSKRSYEYSAPIYKERRTTAFIHGVGGRVNIAWNLTKNAFYKIDDIFVEEVENCPEPLNIEVSDIKENSVTVQWDDDFGTAWEYVIQKSGIGKPSGNGVTVTSKNVTATTDLLGNTLEGQTEYEVYVRTVCENGSYSIWSYPYVFTTKCSQVFNIPFWEGFNDINSWPDCWTIVDANGDNYLFTENCWMFSDIYSYEGKGSARFSAGPYGAITPQDDWLISPKIMIEKGKSYNLKYQYKTPNDISAFGFTSDYEFEVLLSDSGSGLGNFEKVILPKKKYITEDNWKEESILISGIEGEVNIAWHVTSTSSFVDLFIDNVIIEEAPDCREPLASTMGVKDIDKDKVIIFWDDNFGATDWEYYVQEAGGTTPVGDGIATKNKENAVSHDRKGEVLESSTDYEFYIRTNCGNGEYSIWTGPYLFRTLCGGSYNAPFWEGFNSGSKLIDCWTVVDANNDGDTISGINLWTNDGMLSPKYEGDKGMTLVNLFSPGQNDDWLISPKINLKRGQYILKYHYLCMPDLSGFTFDNKFEVLLSTLGEGIDNFTNTIVPNRSYTNEKWQEEVVFIDSINDDVNLAWRVTGDGFTLVGLDNIHLKEVITCPEPYYIKISNKSANSVDIEWEQYDNSTEWEVIVVNYREDETATPVFTTTVTGTPETTIIGLSEGKIYSVYVRAKCENSTGYSEWSTPLDISGEVSNDECSDAINIPVNKQDCQVTVSGITRGTTLSTGGMGGCVVSGIELYDIWFEFTATSDLHAFSVEEIIDLDDVELEQSLGVMIYDQDCFSIANPSAAAIHCFYTRKEVNFLPNLQPGQKYYIRIFANREVYLDLCIRELNYLEVSQEGDKYVENELIKSVLFQSNCNVVSNIKIQGGEGRNGKNSIGYFNNNNSDFPFEEGIVLTTHNVTTAPGPQGTTKVKEQRWTGDDDINLFIDQNFNPNHSAAGGAKFISTLEFDFIAVKDSIQFELLFASDLFRDNWACSQDAFVVALLTDITTREKENIALVPGTDNPIATSTIRDSELLGVPCESINQEYFQNYYDESLFGNSYYAPVDYVGMTVPIMSKIMPLILGRKYNIKFAVVDFEVGHFNLGPGSALFINASAFNFEIENEGDLFIDVKRNICAEESLLLRTSLAESEMFNVDIQWYRDNELLVGANSFELEVDKGGIYEIKIKFLDLDCEISDLVEIKQYSPISETVHQAESLVVCQYSLQETIVNLTSVESAMFRDVDRSIYTTGYYQTAEDAEAAENAIAEAANYSLGKEPQAQTLYIRIENTVTGCHEVFELHIQPEEGAVPDQLENVRVCAEYVFPETAGNQYYYTEPGGQGTVYQAGDVLAESGEHTIYLLQVNSAEGCYEEIAYQVNITAPVTADVFEDKTLSCEYYQLAPLSEHNRYYTEPKREGTELHAGMQILHKQTVYVYASSEDGLCTDESSFTIDYEDCPIPRGISPNNDGLNDVFDLTPHGVESIKIYNRWGTEVYSHGEGYTTQWHGQNKSGKQLPDGTYYYVIQAHGKTRTGWVQINK